MKKKSTRRIPRANKPAVNPHNESLFALDSVSTALADKLFAIRRDYGSISNFLKKAEAQTAASDTEHKQRVSRSFDVIRNGRRIVKARA